MCIVPVPSQVKCKIRCSSEMAPGVNPNETAITRLVKSTDAFNQQGAGGKLCCYWE